jgi:uncharacterized protein YeaO (DUF488 family)
MIKVKRVYESKELDDGRWILVERLWPRGIKREKIDLWLKDIAPSTELRVWFSHDPAKWEEFQKKYFSELEKNKAVEQIFKMASTGNITLVYSARDTQRNSAVALQKYLQIKAKQ